MRRLVAILIILAALAAGWSGAWFWLAGWADRNAGSVLKQIAQRGVEVDCRDRSVNGFPFAMRITCGETAVAETSTGTRAKLGRVTGGASVFAPTTARIDMASPVHVESRYLEKPTDIRWSDAVLNIAVGLNGPRNASFDATGLSAAFALPRFFDPAVAAAHTAGKLAPTEDGGTDAAVAFTDIVVSADGTTFPPVSGHASGRLSVPPRALLAGRAGLAPPISAHAIDIALDSGGARLNAEGDISVDADGVLDGVVTLRVAGAGAIPAFVAALPPEMQKLGNAVAGALFAVGRPTTIDGEPASEVVVKIDHGVARLGMFEKELPRVRL